MRLVSAFAGAVALGVVTIASSPLLAQASPYNWTGFYIGGNAGGTFSGNSAFSGGGQIGYSYQINPTWVLGIEADLQSANLDRRSSSAQAFPASVPGAPFQCSVEAPAIGGFPSRTIDFADPNGLFRDVLQSAFGFRAATTPAQCDAIRLNQQVRLTLGGAFGARAPTLLFTNSPTAASYSLLGTLDWFGTVRGRLGFEPANGFLLYVTGGLAYGEGQLAYTTTTQTTVTPINTFVFPTTNTLSAFTTISEKMLVGYALGGGAEYALGRNWSIKGEYLYVDLGKVSVGSQTVKFNTSVARIGINYRFGG